MNFKSIVAGVAVLTCCLGNAAPAQAWSKQGEFNRFWNNNIHPLVQEVNSHIDSGDVAAECEATWELWALFDRYEWDYGSVRRWDEDLDQVMTVNEKNVDWCGEWKAEQDRIEKERKDAEWAAGQPQRDAEAAQRLEAFFSQQTIRVYESLEGNFFCDGMNNVSGVSVESAIARGYRIIGQSVVNPPSLFGGNCLSTVYIMSR